MKKNLICLLLSILLLLPGCAEITQLGAYVEPIETTRPTAPPLNEESTLTVTYLDVGQGDATLVACDGAYMLIDGGETSASNLVYSVLKDKDITRLDYIVATHAHSDHVGGLSGALNFASPGVVYCPVTSYDSKSFNNFVKYVERGGATTTAPTAGDTFPLGGATVTILGPINEYDETNDTSIVLRIDHGENSFLFTGDMERTAELDLVDGGIDLEAKVLKVGHHGSTTSSSYPFLRAVNCEYAVISCAENNTYDHPHEETLSKLSDADADVLRTDLEGDITFVSDRSNLTLTTGKSSKASPAIPDGGEPVSQYIGNINAFKFHLPTCAGLPKEHNRIYFSSRGEALSARNLPCGLCQP